MGKLKIPFVEKSTIYLLLLILSAVGCKSAKNESDRRNFVGDIIANEELDDATFNICGSEKEVFQYFNTGKGISIDREKKALDTKLFKLFKDNTFRDNGYVRIRFIVNCRGESGRFRVLTSDLQFNEIKMSASTTEPLLKACKDIKGWKPLIYDEKPRDYYQYLTFKIVDGKIKEILP